jgi:hypothetical protein
MVIMVTRTRLNVTFICTLFVLINKTLLYVVELRKKWPVTLFTQNQSVGVELFHADGLLKWMDTTKLTVAIRSCFAKRPTKKKITFIEQWPYLKLILAQLAKDLLWFLLNLKDHFSIHKSKHSGLLTHNIFSLSSAQNLISAVLL